MLAGARQGVQEKRPSAVRQGVVNLPTHEANWEAHALAGKGRTFDSLCGSVGHTEPQWRNVSIYFKKKLISVRKGEEER